MDDHDQWFQTVEMLQTYSRSGLVFLGSVKMVNHYVLTQDFDVTPLLSFLFFIFFYVKDEFFYMNW